MGRHRRTRERQLDLEWDRPMRWEDLPSAVRERVRAEVVVLLHHAAGTDHAVEPADAE
jgi:hypothetical protein